MARLLLCFSLLSLCFATYAQADNTHRLQSQQREMQAFFGDTSQGFVASGCNPSVPASSLTFATFPCQGYAQDGAELIYINQDTNAVGPLNAGNGTYFLAIHRDISGGVSGWTRQFGTHYLWQQSATRPAAQNGVLIYAEVTVSDDEITAVDDIRATNMLPRGAPIYVTDAVYGAVCDGSTDDTAAIQAALDNAGNAGSSREVKLPEGTCMSGPLTLPLDVKLSGGTNQTSILKSNASGTLLTVGGPGTQVQDGAVIEDLRLEGDATGTIGLVLRNVAYTKINRVHINNFTTKGLDCHGCLVLNVVDTRIDSSVIGVDGRADDQPPNLVQFVRPVIRSNTTNGLQWAGGGLLNIFEGDIENNGTSGNAATGAIKIEGQCTVGEGVGAVISGTWFELNSGHSAIRFNNAAAAPCRHVVRDSHVISGTRTYGVYAEGANTTVVLDTVVAQNAGTNDIFMGTGVEAHIRHSAASTQSLTSIVTADPRPINNDFRDFWTGNNNTWNAGTSHTFQIGAAQKLFIRSTGVEIGTGSGVMTINSILRGTATWDPPNMPSDGDVESTTVTVTGLATSNTCSANHDQLGGNNVLISCHVQSANTARVVLMNKTGLALDVASGTVVVTALKD